MNTSGTILPFVSPKREGPRYLRPWIGAALVILTICLVASIPDGKKDGIKSSFEVMD